MFVYVCVCVCDNFSPLIVCFRMSLQFLVSQTVSKFIFEVVSSSVTHLYSSASAPAFEGEPMFELSLGKCLHT